VIQRFQIEDMIAQDPSGVLFRAMDHETGRSVALRRFFPYGAGGGGLGEAEQQAYAEVMRRLSGLDHPALRAVVGGGCDPVDGMPFLACEWVEGETLAERLEQGPLEPSRVIALMDRALEACERLSEVFGVEQVWIETAPDTVILAGEGGSGSETFCFAPLRWLGGGEPHGLGPLVGWVEVMTGWSGLAVADQAGEGLGGWLRWLRQNAAHASLGDARAALAQRPIAAGPVAGAPPPPSPPSSPSSLPPVMPSRVARIAPPRVAPKRSKGTWVVVLCLIALGAGAFGFRQFAKHRALKAMAGHAAEPEITGSALDQAENLPEPPVPAAPDAGSPAASDPAPVADAEPEADATPEAETASRSLGGEPDRDAIRRRAEELTRRAAGGAADEAPAAATDPAELAAQKAAVEARGGVFHPGDVALLREQDGKEVKLEGALAGFDYSNSRKTMYLVFDDPDAWAARGEIVLSRAGEGLTEKDLESLKGRKLRLSGKLELQGLRNGTRPLVALSRRDQIQSVE
jgi:hypothetical protein